MAVTITPVDLQRARKVAATVRDPEMPMLTLADLGVLREVASVGSAVVVTITPTYSGCPAMATIRADLVVALHAAGFDTWTYAPRSTRPGAPTGSPPTAGARSPSTGSHRPVRHTHAVPGLSP